MLIMFDVAKSDAGLQVMIRGGAPTRKATSVMQWLRSLTKSMNALIRSA